MQAQIARHKTAISRSDLSRPIKLAITDGLLAPERTLFDYGCGLGDDLRLLRATGYDAAGWDPVHRPEESPKPAKVVNLGYVVNVIEKPDERQEALRRAWDLAEELLIVSARTTMDNRVFGPTSGFADGLLTSRSTFQKFFDQQELRNWIDHTLNVPSVPAAPGIFYVFRDEAERAAYMASRYRRRTAAPRITRSAELFRQHEELLAPLMAFMGEQGRIPADDELSNASAVREVFGSLRKAFQVILRVTERDRWDDVARQRAEDLLIYLALVRFDGRPAFGKLPLPMQRDVKEFFRTYIAACNEADETLLALGKPGLVTLACQGSKVGKCMPEALYVHESALSSLSTILRLYEGCARGYIGRVDGANLIKLHRSAPKVSYLSYPEFETDPHPALARAVTVHLQTFHVESRDYRQYKNPPILHRKEAFIAEDHPLREKFARLTRIEEEKGLYRDPSRIGTRAGWNDLLAGNGLALRGHRLIRRDGEPN
jgi:DNA phosphorothioation-associated putative methyltransferase